MLQLKNDLVFKMVFGDHRHVEIIRAFLIAALDIPAWEYEGLEIVGPRPELGSLGDKPDVMSVRVQLKNKKLISVETRPYRAAFSAGRDLSGDIDPGLNRAAIEKAVTIVIADRDMTCGESYHHVFRLYDKDNGVTLTDAMEIHTLELGKLPEAVGADEKERMLLNWLRLIRSERADEIEALAAKTEEMKMAVARLKQLSADERARELFEERRLRLMNEASTAESEAKGRAEGKIEGKLEMVEQMLRGGFDVDLISKISGISAGEIKNLEISANI